VNGSPQRRVNGSSLGPEDVEVCVVGAGFSGLAMGYYLREAKIDSFVILERASEVGGTWRDNTYPGAACDIPSHLYSFSFEPNPTWSRSFSPQPEILDYMKHVARKFDLVRHVRLGSDVTRATWDEALGRWIVGTADGRVYRARSLALGNGALSVPSIPKLRGLERFGGKAFHSARWDHGYDLAEKRVAVIGTGASAIQFVPAIQPTVARLSLFQRTAPWILPKADRDLGALERALFRRAPIAQKAVRAAIYWMLEWRAAGFTRDPRILRLVEHLARRHLRRAVKDPALREKLTPHYPMGCKRILLSNDYYASLQHPNVELVTDGIEEIEPTGVRTKDGRLHEVDAILFGTGFDITGYLSPIRIVGEAGQELSETWKSAPETYLGIGVAGFPNLSLLMGPNTGLGHNSMIFMIEAQARYAVACARLLRDRSLRALDVRPSAQAAFNAEVQRKSRRTVWTSGCNSWYLGPDGRNISLWPGFTVEYWWRTRKPDLDAYVART
jgi:cation diffusion facilitator CzcD-associated flavoprotein CzcO